MKTLYKILENLNKEGILTIRIEGSQLAFNHTKIHAKDEYEEFGIQDIGIETIKGIKMHHVNGHIISPKEFRFINRVLDDL